VFLKHRPFSSCQWGWHYGQENSWHVEAHDFTFDLILLHCPFWPSWPNSQLGAKQSTWPRWSKNQALVKKTKLFVLNTVMYRIATYSAMVWDITVWIFYADLCTSEVCVAIFHIVHMPANKSEWHCFSIYFYAVHDWHVLWSPFCCHFPFCVFSDAPSASLWIHPLSHPPFAKKSECPLS